MPLHNYECRRKPYPIAFLDSEEQVVNNTAEKNTLGNKLDMVCVTVPLILVFVGNGNLQHSVAGWKLMSYLRYHTYFTKSNINVRYASALASNGLFPIRRNNTDTPDDEEMLATVESSEKWY